MNREGGTSLVQVKLGEVELKDAPADEQMVQIKKELLAVGFEMLDDQKQKIIEKIKTTILGRIRQEEMDGADIFSRILSEALHKDYSYLSKLFSE